MTSINSEVRSEKQFLNLKLIKKEDVKKEALKLLVKDEIVEGAFQTIRDQVIFTNKRVMTVNYQGVTGTKTSIFCYPYSKIQYYAIETAGLVDIDSELNIFFSNGISLKLEFRTWVDIERLCAVISNYVL